MRSPTIILIIFLIIAACTQTPPTVSEAEIQTAIAKTQAARPIITNTKLPTNPVSPVVTGTIRPTPKDTIAITESPTATRPTDPEFSYKSANHSLPQDIIKEVAYSETGGGGGCSAGHLYPNPTAVIRFKTFQLGGFISIPFCGWNNDPLVRTTIELPDGRKIEKDNKNVFDDMYISLETSLDDPEGDYSFYADGQNGSANISVKLIQPIGPKLLYLYNENKWFLYNFQPFERIRLFSYSPEGVTERGIAELMAWQEYYSDANGQLIIKIVDEKLILSRLFIIGDKSGEARSAWMGPNIWLETSCKGAPRQNMIVGKLGRVCTKSDNLIVRKNPNRSGEEITRVPPQTIFLVVDGPSCADDWSWWKIITESGIVGWVSEGGDNIDQYFICPTFLH